MAYTTISLTLPEATYRRLQRAAAMTYRSPDEVMVATLEAALPAPEDLPAELADELAAMYLMSDEALLAAVHPSMSRAEQERLAQVSAVAGERPLTAAESAEHEALMAAYHRAVLRRAQAAAILALRGHDAKQILLQTATPG
jgi:hypothetical protein